MPQIFSIQEHNASHHHNLRLEINAVLKSFALPKTPPTEHGIKRLAVQTKDHPLEYADIESEIPQRHHTAATPTPRILSVLIVKNPTKDDTTLFELSGSKLQGRYALIKAE